MSSYNDQNLITAQEEGAIVLPCRIDVCLPGTPDRRLPIPLDRVYSVDDQSLVTDCFKTLNYAVHLLLEMSSHLSPNERERLAQAPCAFIHPESSLLIPTTERSFANFAMECILTQHNSRDPILLSPSWPSVFFDDDGYPFFGEASEETRTNTRFVPPSPPATTLGSSEKSLAGEPFAVCPETEEEKHPHFLSEAQEKKQYVPEPSKKRRHVRLEQQPGEWVTLTLPRL